MKKLLTKFAVLLACSVFFSSCQKTPEAPVVIEKDNEALLQKATETGAAQLILPSERYRAEVPLGNPQGTLIVEIDADVFASGLGGLASARVQKHIFTESECAAYVAALFDGQTTYSGEVLATKELCRQEILYMQQILFTETDEERRVELQGSIEKLTMSMENMPEGEGLVETSAEFRSVSGAFESMFLVSDGGDGQFRTFNVDVNPDLNLFQLRYSIGRNNYAEIGNLWNIAVNNELNHGLEEYASPDVLPNLTVTQKEAVAGADALLLQMGVSDYTFKAVEVVYGSINGVLQKAFRLHYTRILGNHSFTLASENAEGALDDGRGDYILGWKNESLTFVVNNEGVVSLDWVNPYEVSEIVTEDTALLPFEEVMSIFEKMIVVKNAYIEDDMSIAIRVDRIELGLIRITDPDTRTTGLVVPAWDFFGEITYSFENDEAAISNNPMDSFLAVNAIDGTVIDRIVGY